MADTLLDLVLPLTMIVVQLSDYYGHLTLGLINDTRKSLKCATQTYDQENNADEAPFYFNKL